MAGDIPSAMDWMDRAVRMGDSGEEWLRRDPCLAKLRDQPRFQQMLDSVAYLRKQWPAGAGSR